MDLRTPAGPIRWSGLAIDDEQYERVIDAYASDVLSNGVLDTTSRAKVLELAERSVRRHRRELEEDDSVPFLAHAVLSQGNRRVGATSLLERLGEFVLAGAMPQADVEGDFHPWQSFAYALLAGVPRDTVMTPGGDTLGSVIAHSTNLCVDEPEDLGHALVTLGMLPAADRPAVLRFGGVDTPAELLVGHAIRAHYLGHFRVCRKFHLTEGIVLAVARLPGLQRFAAYPAELVAGQMRVLKVLAVLLRLLATPRAQAELITKLQDALRLGPLFENHLFYSGHLLEIAGVAAAHGHDTPVRWLNSVVNDTNTFLRGGLLDTPSPLKSTLVQMSHYHRALLSWTGGPGGPGTATGTATGPRAWPGVRAADPPGPRPRFVEVLDAYEALRDRSPTSPVSGFRLRGTFPHFRRAHAAGWPKQLHYEMLDYGDGVGVELHFESPQLGAVAQLVHSRTDALASVAADRVDWDPTWWRGTGRLRLHYGDARQAVDVANGMESLIACTVGPLRHLYGP